MKTSYIILGVAAVLVLVLLLNKSGTVTKGKSSTNLSGGAGYIAATGSLLTGAGNLYSSISDSSTGDE
jgi:sugar/nucleoside kinase (ribokinase family)